jgi:hypothetical protein
VGKVTLKIFKREMEIMMRISSTAKQLAEHRYIQKAQQISSEHYANISRHEQTMPRGGAMKGAIDNEHVRMAREIAEAYVNCHMEVFIAEGLIPDVNDLREMKAEIENIIGRHKGGEFWTPRPSTSEALHWLPQQVYIDLANRVKQMELESRMPKPAQSAAPGSINIQGHNFGPIQQAGQGNTQNVTINAQFNAKIDELLNLIDVAQELSPVQKLKANTDIRYVQELSKLEPSAEVQEEAKSRLDGVTSVISLSADLVSLGMPIIQIIRAFFGV